MDTKKKTQKKLAVSEITGTGHHFEYDRPRFWYKNPFRDRLPAIYDSKKWFKIDFLLSITGQKENFP